MLSGIKMGHSSPAVMDNNTDGVFAIVTRLGAPAEESPSAGPLKNVCIIG